MHRDSSNNLSLILPASGSLGRAGFSSYTYDALFTSDAPNLVVSGFEALFGTGFDSGLAGILAGDLSVADFVLSLAPGPWTLAMLAIQYPGMLSCPQSQQVTAMKRDTRLCEDLGEYCSQRLPIIRTCLTQTHTFCCFNSRLARLINEQGRTQLRPRMGDGATARLQRFLGGRTTGPRLRPHGPLRVLCGDRANVTQRSGRGQPCLQPGPPVLLRARSMLDCSGAGNSHVHPRNGVILQRSGTIRVGPSARSSWPYGR